jgi:hypothetical protein
MTPGLIRIFSKLLLLHLLLLPCFFGRAQINLRFEQNQTLAYHEVIADYTWLDSTYETARLLEYGPTDIGKPLHLFVISADKQFDPAKLRHSGKRIILIMNGIHPGESAGVDASIRFADELLRNVNNIAGYLENTVVCIIPVYNISGLLVRSHYNRVHQNGPEETGFRGSAQNLDLNRDFIKADSENTQSFYRLFQEWQPDIFLDTHVTNGSDHQYTITLIATNTQKIQPAIGQYMEKTFIPGLYRLMAETPYEMIPYVDYFIETPEQGITVQDDLPRYSTGYTSLFNTIGFLCEIHSCKPFPEQVRSVYHFMVSLLALTHDQAATIGSIREKAIAETCRQDSFALQWELDSTRWDSITFKGYARKLKTGELTGHEWYYYDQSQPYTKVIPYYWYFKPVNVVKKPSAYILPQAWESVIERLQWNIIKMERLTNDTIISVEAYYITDITFAERPSNGHFKHEDIKVRSYIQDIQFYKGDYIIPVSQPGNRYIVETLEPDGPDSFLSWNFFDGILDRREYYSPEDFEKIAVELLETYPELKTAFEQRKNEDPGFSADYAGQLQFVYLNSPYAEKSWRRYPVYRMENPGVKAGTE